MAHTSLFDRLLRSLWLAHDCEEAGVTTEEGMARRAEAESRRADEGMPRRQLLGAMGALAATGVVASLSVGCATEDPEGGASEALVKASGLDVGIVGAGLAGLSCADQLKQNGAIATIYEASARVGGRQFSQAGFFPGQVVELGGELIDTSQKNMVNLARKYGLTLEDYNKSPGAVFYYIAGKQVPEADVVNDFRAFVPAMKADLQQLSAAPTADTHNAFDAQIDAMSIADYLVSRGASALLRAVVAAAYVGEYGREVTDQSALNFVLYVRANRRSTFQPFGTSDQRYHIVEGNDGVAKGLASGLAGQIQLGKALTAVRKLASGKYELTFKDGTVRAHDIVVLAIPFTVLRGVTLDASLGLPGWKLKAINELGYGSNSKNMVGFDGRPWVAAGSMGMTYATLPSIQNCWETSWTTSTQAHAVMTNFTGGALGASQDPALLQSQTAAFLTDFDSIYPGASALASRDSNGKYKASMMAWPKNPWSKASYTCYRPGQFTSIAGNEGKPVGSLYFAGEHCDSFYNQQGFMEGAIASGLTNAAAILATV